MDHHEYIIAKLDLVKRENQALALAIEEMRLRLDKIARISHEMDISIQSAYSQAKRDSFGDG